MIATRLRQLAQLRSRIFRQRAALASTAIVLGGLLLVAAVDVRIGVPWMVRLAALAAILIGSAVLFRRWKSRATERDAARLVEAAHPDLGQSVRTAAQLAPHLDASRPPIEAALVARTEQRTAPLLLDAELAPRRALVPAACAAGTLALAWIVALGVSPDWRTAAARALGWPATYTRVKAAAHPAALKADEAVRIVATLSGRRTEQAVVQVRAEGEEWRTLPMTPVAPQQFDAMLSGLAQPLEYYVTSGDGRSSTGRVTVHLPPKLLRISTRLEPPAYLGLASTEHLGGDLEGIEGTKAGVALEFDRAVAEARAVFSDGTSAPLALEGTRARVEFILPASDRTWHIAGRDPSGVEFQTPPNRVKGKADKPPTVKLAEPRDAVEVTPLHELLARVSAKDDHGLATIGIVLQVGTKEEKLLEKKIEARDVRQVAEMTVAFLEKHALTLHDSLLVYAYATDHKPRDGARAVSAMAAVDIREFKRLYVLANAAACACHQLLEKMIAQQRRVYSDTTQLRELRGSQAVPPALILPLIDRERTVDTLGHQLQDLVAEDLEPDARRWEEAAARIVGHLHTAGEHLRAPQLADACTSENLALTEMLQLRKQMLYKRTKKPGERMTESEPNRGAAEFSTLTQLAEKIEAAAKEEHEIAAQAAEESGRATRVRQHEGATGDVGDVLTELDGHPAATEAVRKRGTHAESLMHAATKALTTTPAQSAASLATAEAALRELAAHLRLLDQPPDESALTKLEKRAEEAAECLTSGASGAKNGTGKGKGSASGEKPADFSEKVAALAEQAVTLDDALRKWSAGEADSPPSPTGQALGKLAAAQHTAQLGQELRALAKDLAKAGDGEDSALAEQAEALAKQQQSLAAALRQEREGLRQTRAQQLTELRRRVQEMSGDHFIGVANPVHGGIEASMAAKNRIARSLAGGAGTNVLAELQASHDPELEKWAAYLQANLNRLPFVWRGLRSVDARLATILAELKRTAPIAVRESTVPDEYRRVVENYFRTLSDDFGSEDEEAPVPATK